MEISPYGHFAVWTFRRMDILPYGHFAVWTIRRRPFRRMDILPYGRFAVYINGTFRRQLFIKRIIHFEGQFKTKIPA